MTFSVVVCLFLEKCQCLVQLVITNKNRVHEYKRFLVRTRMHTNILSLFFWRNLHSFRVRACTRARHRGRARRRRGCQRVLSGRGGVKRSAVAAFVPRCRVCLETRGKHEWALPGLHLPNSIEYVRVIRFVRHCKVRFKRCLFLRPGWSSQREPRSLSINIVELENERHGEHRASREARDGSHCGRKGGKLYPDRIGGEVVAREVGGARGWERSSTVRFFFYWPMTGVPIGQKIITRGGTGICILSELFGIIFNAVAVLLCRAFFFVHTSTVIHHVKRRKQVTYLGHLRMYDMWARMEGGTACDAKRMWRSSCFSPEAWRWRTLGIIKSPVCDCNHQKKLFVFNHESLFASHNLMCFSFLSESRGRRRPPAERSALYLLIVFRIYLVLVFTCLMSNFVFSKLWNELVFLPALRRIKKTY